MFNLSVYPTPSYKVFPFISFLGAVSIVFRRSPVGATKSIADIFHHLSLSLQDITRSGSVAASNSWSRDIAGQQHIYDPLGKQAVNCAHSGRYLIRFSNGRTPHTTKQVIFWPSFFRRWGIDPGFLPGVLFFQ